VVIGFYLTKTTEFLLSLLSFCENVRVLLALVFVIITVDAISYLHKLFRCK